MLVSSVVIFREQSLRVCKIQMMSYSSATELWSQNNLLRVYMPVQWPPLGRGWS